MKQSQPDYLTEQVLLERKQEQT